MMEEKVKPDQHQLGGGDEMFSVISDMEGTNVEFQRVAHLIQIYGEQLEEELSILELEKSGLAAYFMIRFAALRSLLETIEIHMDGALKESQKNVDTGYDILRVARREKVEGVE